MTLSNSSLNPITLELYRHRFAAVAEEMGESLRRTGFSPNIKERLDFSCALFDASGEMVAQAAHIPVHLGAMPASVAAACEAINQWQPGDVAILNDPFAGGTHLPDITLVAPVFCGQTTPQFFVANRAHHADIGGMTPGSLPLSVEIYQEGFIIPPLLLVQAGETNRAIMALLLANVRTPEERRGDLEAQLAACVLGTRRLEEMTEKFGLGEVEEYAAHLLDYSQHRAQAAIASWPQGVFSASDSLEIEGFEAKIQVAATIGEGRIRFDFAGTSPQLPSSLNAVEAIARSACYYVASCLIGDDVPQNAGIFRVVEVVTPPRSLVNAQSPAAVAGGNVETSQRITDCLFQALAQVLPERVPACSQGTMNNLTMGGLGTNGAPWTYYETIAGGAGASPQGDGASAIQSHMTNTLNTPIEALERAFPLRVTRLAIRENSGGAGQFYGGDGLVREIEFIGEARVTMLSQRRKLGPPGAQGGMSGEVGRNLLIQGAEETLLEGQFSTKFNAGDRLRIETPGGGGWNQPHEGSQPPQSN